jgi:putative endonuclease
VSGSWHCYLLRCADDTLYTGATNDLPRRLRQHRAGRGARYTRSRGPLQLAWSTACDDRSAALQLEARIKRLSRQQKLALIDGKTRHLHLDLNASAPPPNRRPTDAGPAAGKQ